VAIKIPDAIDRIADQAETIASSETGPVGSAFGAFSSLLHALADELRATPGNSPGPGPGPTLPDKL
jgi:hypothetical protein